MPNCPPGSSPNQALSASNDQPVAPMAKPLASSPASAPPAASTHSQPCTRDAGSHQATPHSSNPARPIHSQGRPCCSACTNALAVSVPPKTPGSARHSDRFCG